MTRSSFEFVTEEHYLAEFNVNFRCELLNRKLFIFLEMIVFRDASAGYIILKNQWQHVYYFPKVKAIFEFPSYMCPVSIPFAPLVILN